MAGVTENALAVRFERPATRNFQFENRHPFAGWIWWPAVRVDRVPCGSREKLLWRAGATTARGGNQEAAREATGLASVSR